jgi:hypothetical protein
MRPRQRRLSPLTRRETRTSPAHPVPGHAFIAKLSSDGAAFRYYVSLAGTAQDADTISMYAGGNVVVAGHSTSPDFPVSPGAAQGRIHGTQNVFVAKLDPEGRVIFSTYLGGRGEGQGDIDTPAVLSQTDRLVVLDAVPGTARGVQEGHGSALGFRGGIAVEPL